MLHCCLELKTNKCISCDKIMRSGRTFSLTFRSQGIKAIKEGTSCLLSTFLSFPFEQTYYYSILSSGSCKNLCSVCNMYYIYCFCNSIQRLCNQNSEIPGIASSVVLAFSQSVFIVIR